MEASNYYAGYTSGAQHSQGFTQVQNPPIQTSYAAPQATTGYAVQGTAQTAAHYGPPQTQAPRQVVQQAAYSAASTAYAQTAPTQGSAYGYTARQQDAPPPPPPTNTAYQAASHAAYQTHPASQTYYERDAYDTKANYYSQQPASSVQGSQGAYYAPVATATAKAAYQASAATAYPTPVSATRVAAKSHPAQAYTSSSTVAYPYSSARTNTNYNNQGSYTTSTYGNSNTAATDSYHPQAYEAAVYNAAAAYVQQQQQHHQPSRPNWKNKSGMSGMPSNKQQKPKAPPKQPQIHYCDICKISCAGPQTYKEHLEGQKHKKKEASSKAKPEANANNSNSYCCELCDITCTGADAYAAHLKGSKHQKVVKLHVKLGKPIPEILPIKAPEPKENKEGEEKTKVASNNRNQGRKNAAKRPVAPKITFVGGTKLTTTGVVKTNDASEGSTAQAGQAQQGATAAGKDEESLDSSADGEEKFDLATFTGVDKSKIVGSDYLEEIKSDDGKVVSFQCKLCECKFNDPNAKEAHLAGRRHRLQYKKKVQPDLVVETKPSNRRLSKTQEDKLRRQWEQENLWRWRRDEEARWHEEEARRWEEGEYLRRMEEERFWEEEHRRRYEGDFMEWSDRTLPGSHAPTGGVPPRLMDAPMPRPRFDSADDRMVMAKHSAIYPTESELQAVQNIVSASEKALKCVSDVIAEQDNPPMEVETAAADVEVKEEVKEESKPEDKTEEAAAEKTEGETEEENKDPAKQQAPRALKGVMRVGVLAKGLLLRGRLDVDLVVLCHNKPTLSLLKRVVDLLPAQLERVTEEKYEIKTLPEECGLSVSTTTEPKVTVLVTLTSPIMRDSTEPVNDDEPDVLDRQKCLDALAALRHAKWFQAKANSLQSCVIIIRVMRDMCQRVPAFSPVTDWALELLVEKSLSSSEHPLGPGEAFRRVMECISSGLFQEGGPGLCDPCEKEKVDASADIKMQEAEDLTTAAQHALRLQAFRQLHKVLGIDPPPPMPRYRGRYPRGGRFKRRREDSGQGDEGAKKEKKEGEGDATIEVMDTVTEPNEAAAKTES
ncbi:zinc finger RNA-binding protein-like [Actinia tenebrosa]|uniref:Zinc finger RNA-binding protein-like n=2 Tax=Actinia tenebrosa TaxID=6105 RepID=A0A6P8HAJ9_ACTTE|nr:zinc finger RNA-binding protein-like [Actinia tenebrosa]